MMPYVPFKKTAKMPSGLGHPRKLTWSTHYPYFQESFRGEEDRVLSTFQRSTTFKL